MPEPTADELLQRFEQERMYSWRYVQFHEHQNQVRPSRIRALVERLEKYDLAPRVGPLGVATLRVFDTVNDVLAIDELREIHSQISVVEPQVRAALERADEILRKTTMPPGLDQVDTRSHVGELIQFVLDATDLSALEMLEPTRKQLMEDLVLQLQETGDSHFLGPHGEEMTPEALAEYATRAAIFLRKVRNQGGLIELADELAELDLVIKMSLPDSEINIYRLGFITLTTLFDATIFDMVRVAFRNDFFRLLGGFADNSSSEKLTPQQIAGLGSFEKLREKLIDDHLRGKYLRDLLFILRKLNVPGIDPPDTRSFAEAVEMVMRRNIHIHNRGIVDEGYLERNRHGNPQYNIYNFKLGDQATIDNSYWEHAHETCYTVASCVAIWADALVPHSSERKDAERASDID